MVTRRDGPCQTDAWRRELAQAFQDPVALLEALGIDPVRIPDLDRQRQPFRLLVPRGFAALMTPGDPSDPLLRQVLPLGIEHLATPGFALDPVGDGPATRAPGLLHKYRGRALLMVHGACAVHCRYCFRRHYPYSELGPRQRHLDEALVRIEADRTLAEAVLSGGDPLMLDDSPLARLLDRLDAVPHLQRLRLHSRLPVVLPARVTAELCAVLAGRRLKTVVVAHVNHPRELGLAAEEALARLARSGLTLLNQSVLLAGVNDCPDILASLSEQLFACGVLPYYLHQLDPVQGAAHFLVSDPRALELLHELRTRLPGYLVPRLVRELAGESFKRPLG